MMFIRSALLVLIVLPAVLSKSSSSSSSSSLESKSSKSTKNKKSKKPKDSKFLRESYQLVAGGPPTLTSAVGPVPGTDEVAPLLIGGVFILKGSVVDADDSLFTLACTALEGSDSDNGQITFTRAKCELDVCFGTDEDSGDPDCVYLRFSGAVDVFIDFVNGTTEDITPFKGALTGGSGRYLLSTGQAMIAQSGNVINLDLVTIPSKDIPLFEMSVIVA